ncbi:ATP synthase F1 subunit delta [Candidatus Parcubacteria bacterium]|nr:MAG: ATP synthase F1 subunit delta [Candidatus Parcubacteria bacterium]
MKASSKQYAVTLYDLVEGKTQKEISDVLKSFFELLKKDNVLSRLDDVLKEFNDIWNKENGIVEASVVSARELDKASKKEIVDYIKTASKAEDVVLDESVDEKILGGVIVKYADKIVDSSLKGRVSSLKRSLEK